MIKLSRWRKEGLRLRAVSAGSGAKPEGATGGSIITGWGGMNTYAVGDIHGCFDGFRAILDRIASHAAGEPHRILVLGDYINIGPDSRKVLDHLLETPAIIALCGDHDMMLLAAARGDARSIWNFEYHGGGETLRSFDVAKAADIPARYTDFLRQRLVRYVDDGQRVFVHAAIDPAIGEMAFQDDTTLLCARKSVSPVPDRSAPFVVHGHFPQADGLPEILPHRCNLDTDGCHTGVFTCGIFDDAQADPIDILQVR